MDVEEIRLWLQITSRFVPFFRLFGPRLEPGRFIFGVPTTNSRVVKLTTVLLVMKLMRGVVPPFLHMTSWLCTCSSDRTTLLLHLPSTLPLPVPLT